MPALSSTMTEGKVVAWNKSIGDKIDKGEPIVVIESDKADMDVEAFDSGFLGSIAVQEGESAGVGSAIAFIAETEAELEEAKQKSSGAKAAAPAQEAPPKQEEAPPKQEPEPAMAAAPAQQAPQQQEASQPQPPPQQPQQATPQKRPDGRIIATPYAKDVAKKLGIDLSTVYGSGINGRITAADVEAKAGKAPSTAPEPSSTPTPPLAPTGATNGAVPQQQAQAPPSTPPPQPAAPSQRGTSRPFTGLEKSVSNNMIESKKVPEFRLSVSIETDKFDALQRELKPKGVTTTALLAKACAVALIPHERLYATLTPDQNGLVFPSGVNVAVAVAMPDGGLITPVLKNADQTDIYQLSREWGDLVKRARGKKLKSDEYTTGNFSISNMGMFGVDAFDAMIQPGITSILAVGAAKKQMVVNADNSFGIKKVMQVTITCDHRVAYGVHAAEFLKTLKETVENPDQLLR